MTGDVGTCVGDEVGMNDGLKKIYHSDYAKSLQEMDFIRFCWTFSCWRRGCRISCRETTQRKFQNLNFLYMFPF